MSSAHSKDYYLQKSKNKKSTAWFLFGVGTTLIVVGVAQSLGSSNGFLPAGIVPMVLGAGADLASIPFFISASRNKKLASSVTINSEKILLLQQNSLCLKMQPAITFKINL